MQYKYDIAAPEFSTYMSIIYIISVLKDDYVLQITGSVGCTPMEMCLVPLNCLFKIVTSMLYIFYQKF